MKYVLSTLLLLACVAAWPADLKRLDITLGIRETQSGDSHSSSYNWSLDALVEQPTDDWLYSLTVDSDYTGGDTELDLLRTWWRVMPAKQREWTPVFLISTEGDHSCERMMTLGALGVRHPLPGGFLEFTAGFSKDVRTADDWEGDLGLLIDIREEWGRFSAGIKPQGKLYSTDQVRFRDGEFRYSVDFNASYRLDEHMGIGYHLLRSNLTGTTQSDQFVGITYRH